MSSEYSAGQSDPTASKCVIKEVIGATLDVTSKGWFPLLILIGLYFLFLNLEATKEFALGIYGDLSLQTAEVLPAQAGLVAIIRYFAFVLSSFVLSVAVCLGTSVLVFETGPNDQMNSKIQIAAANIYVSITLLSSLAIIHYTLISESPFENGCGGSVRGDSSSGCGPERAVAEWPRLPARRSDIRPT